EPNVVGHGQLAVEMHGVIQEGAPVVRLAHHVEALGHARDFHAAGDAADVIDDEADLVERATEHVWDVIVGRGHEFAHDNRHVQSGGQLDQAVDVFGGQRVF